MDSICHKCGDRGYSNLLVFCCGCYKYAEHQYCFDEIPKQQENVRWLCEECAPKSCDPLLTKGDNSKTHDEILKIGNYSFSDRKNHAMNKLNVKEVGEKNSIDDNIFEATNVSHKKKRELSLPPKPRKSPLGANVPKHARPQLKPGTYLFRDREKHSMKARNNKKIVRAKKTINDDIINVADVFQENKHELHVPLFEHCLKTWGRHRKRVLNRRRSPTSSNYFKDDPALHDNLHVNEVKSCEVAKSGLLKRNLILAVDDDLANDFVEDIPRVGVENTKQCDVSREVEASILLEEYSTSKRRKCEKPLRVEENHKCDVIEQQVEHGVEATNEFYYVSAWPIVDYIWRGFFKISGKTYGPFNAHLSTKACAEVLNATKVLPPIVHLSKVSRSHEWPKSLNVSPPNPDHIALFFFPCYSWVEEIVEPLMQEIVKGDLVLKIVMDQVELLVIPSNLLSRDYEKFQGKLYLWGTFRSRQPDPTQKAENKPVINPTKKDCNLRASPEKNQNKMFEKEEEEEEETSHLTDGGNGSDPEITACSYEKSSKVEFKSREGKKRLDLELGLSLPFTQ